MDRQRPKNVFDALFFRTVGEALLVYAIAIPFFREDYTSLPLSVGILSVLMWLPFSWIIGHWIGTVHTLARTVLVTHCTFRRRPEAMAGGVRFFGPLGIAHTPRPLLPETSLQAA